MLCGDWLYKCSHDRLLNDKRIMIAYERKRVVVTTWVVMGPRVVSICKRHITTP